VAGVLYEKDRKTLSVVKDDHLVEFKLKYPDVLASWLVTWGIKDTHHVSGLVIDRFPTEFVFHCSDKGTKIAVPVKNREAMMLAIALAEGTIQQMNVTFGAALYEASRVLDTMNSGKGIGKIKLEMEEV